MRTRTARIITLAIAGSLALLPGSALAADGLPDVIVDPPHAVEPAVDVAPDPGAPAVDATDDGEATAEGAGSVPDADGQAGLDTPDVTAGASDVPAVGGGSPAITPAGSLPFTGIGDGQVALLFLVGSLLLAGGVTAVAWARASSETA